MLCLGLEYLGLQPQPFWQILNVLRCILPTPQTNVHKGCPINYRPKTTQWVMYIRCCHGRMDSLPKLSKLSQQTKFASSELVCWNSPRSHSIQIRKHGHCFNCHLSFWGRISSGFACICGGAQPLIILSRPSPTPKHAGCEPEQRLHVPTTALGTTQGTPTPTPNTYQRLSS